MTFTVMYGTAQLEVAIMHLSLVRIHSYVSCPKLASTSNTPDHSDNHNAAITLQKLNQYNPPTWNGNSY